jgi:hypothetical protein
MFAVSQLGEVEAFKLSLNKALVFTAQQGQVIQAGLSRWGDRAGVG